MRCVVYYYVSMLVQSGRRTFMFFCSLFYAQVYEPNPLNLVLTMFCSAQLTLEIVFYYRILRLDIVLASLFFFHFPDWLLCVFVFFIGLLASIASQEPTSLEDSSGMWVFIVALVVVVGVYLACIIYNKFVISKGTGYALVGTYVAFLVFVILYEIFVNGTDSSGGCS